ncbi:type II secretion system secretin GspD [Sphingomonas sp. SUN039]|uniref:type II secretion system secretin GspD n=1 Tax=Sphingomonas sp. SUN039 TaxID=2937787 RepID=UPI002164AA85|nr:type II secretion system secretin GspD [Sphingomonas sp. SUN039]UVO53921.1 type II secretion system secretin GspD [Sphingomonas sp. SUN039]
MKRLGLIAAIALAGAAPTVSLAQQVLNLRDADIRAFIQDAARVTGRTFIIDARVAGKVSVVTDRALSRSEYFEVFLSTLRANGLVAVPTGNGAYRIQPVDGAAAQPGRVGSQGAARNSFVTEVFRLRSIDAAQAVETVRPLVSREGSVTANAAGNSLVVADYADNIRRIRSVIARIDSDSAETRIVPLRNAGAREIATALQALTSVGGPRGTVAVSPVDSSNAIALRGDARAVARFAEIIADLDRRAAAGSEIRVVFLQHADAEKLLPVLQTLVGQTPSITPQVVSNAQTRSLPGTTAAPAATPAATSSAGVSGTSRSPAIIARYEGTNAIIISASADVQRTLGEVIRQLDTRREQVLVEAIIVEISDTAAKKLGIQLAFGGPNGGAFTTYSNVTPSIVPIAGGLLQNQLSGGTTTTTTVNGTTTTTTTGNSNGSTLLQGALSAVNSATGGTAGAAFGLGNNLYLGAIINAVSQDNQSNLLSTPSVVTLDNQEAKILVGQEIPVTTGEALSGNFDNAFRTVQRQNVGIQLEVKPQIGEGGAIKLFLRQEVSSIAGAVTNNSSDLILNKREIQTTMTVDDGQIMAIGGLLDDNERRTLEKTPVLGDIPLLGELFRSRSRSRGKTNLMVFIRPTILRTAEDAKAFAERRYGYVRSQQLLGNPDQEPSIDELMRDYMGVQPPGPVVPQQAAPGEAPPPPPPQIVPSTTSRQVIRPAPVPKDK